MKKRTYYLLFNIVTIVRRIPYIESQQANWQETVENQPTFHTKSLLRSTNRTTACTPYAVGPPAQYSSAYPPENAPNIFDVPCVACAPTVSIVCTGIRCSNRQLDPSNLVYHDLECGRETRHRIALFFTHLQILNVTSALSEQFKMC